MSTPSLTQDPEQPQLLRLAPGMYVRQEIDNIAWLDLGPHLLVIDALERAELRDEVFALLDRTVPGKSVRYVLNTHTHYDHVALNDAFRQRDGAEIVNARTTAIPAAGKTFPGHERSALMLPLPHCHTADDCVIWVPEDRVLFVGDIFGWGLIPCDRPLTAAKRDELIAAYRRLIAFGAERVVPGHGPLATTATLERWLEYFEWLIQAVKNAAARGACETEIAGGAIAPPADMRDWWRFCQWKHADAVKKVARAVVNNRL